MKTVMHFTESEMSALITDAVLSRGLPIQHAGPVKFKVEEVLDAVRDQPTGDYRISCEIEVDFTAK